MPIVDGKYEAKIGATFATVEEGIAEIKRTEVTENQNQQHPDALA